MKPKEEKEVCKVLMSFDKRIEGIEDFLNVMSDNLIQCQKILIKLSKENKL